MDYIPLTKDFTFSLMIIESAEVKPNIDIRTREVKSQATADLRRFTNWEDLVRLITYDCIIL